MKEQLLGKNYSQSVNLLIFIFPIVIISLQVAGDLVLFILAMMGIFIAISKKLSPFAIQEIKVFSYLTFGYFLAVCISVLFSGQATALAHFIPRDFHFLFAPFIALALFKAEININYLLSGIKLGLLFIGLVILYRFEAGYTLPSGVMNSAVLGNLAVSLFFVILVFFQKESFKNKAFSLLSLLSGLFIIIASGTRGAWLSFFLLSGVYLYFLYKQKNNLNIKSKFFIVLIIALIISIPVFSQSFKDRTQSAYTEITSWVSGDTSATSGVLHKSVSVRLDMYSLAIEKIKDVPFFGHGYRTSNVVVFEDVKSSSGQLAYTYNHLHNAYLTNYFNGGVILLGALLLLIFAPLRIFLKANIQNREDPVFIAGALLSLGYASFGFVNILFGDTYMNGFYVFFLAIILLLTIKFIKKPEV
ncbi:O-antigen ligase family protein [Candidatus Pseudothioglobus sp. Uisw_041]|uniref:O-antigen ligase family protein n=1 Tax=Candidatus Pseudothioglobus sp. Uisw_041 TaxID=3230996 RepID=UPI003A84A22E